MERRILRNPSKAFPPCLTSRMLVVPVPIFLITQVPAPDLIILRKSDTTLLGTSPILLTRIVLLVPDTQKGNPAVTTTRSPYETKLCSKAQALAWEKASSIVEQPFSHSTGKTPSHLWLPQTEYRPSRHNSSDGYAHSACPGCQEVASRPEICHLVLQQPQASGPSRSQCKTPDADHSPLPSHYAPRTNKADPASRYSPLD